MTSFEPVRVEQVRELVQKLQVHMIFDKMNLSVILSKIDLSVFAHFETSLTNLTCRDSYLFRLGYFPDRLRDRLIFNPQKWTGCLSKGLKINLSINLSRK